jgi:glycosyltransferase involved in cell wall biosynthesis
MRKKTNNKTNDAIFFARISKEKGIFNLIRIWKQISYTLSHAKLFVYGSGSKATVKKLIMQIKSNNLDDTFFYCGYIENEQELYEKVAISKIFLYPSYSDAFPLGIIESLALGTPVVAYDIPAVNNVYSNLNAVKIVKKGDIKGFSQEILKIFALDAKSYEEMIEEPRLKEFLTKHSIWKNVVDNEVMKIYEIMS